MKKLFFAILFFIFATTAYSQEKLDTKVNGMLVEMSDDICKCIDSISVVDRRKKAISADISRCIDDKAVSYQMGSKLLNLDLGDATTVSDEKKTVNISIATDKDSEEYKKYYYDMERYLMANCPAMKNKMAENNMINEKSVSSDKKAMEYYTLALAETQKENYKGAIEYYKKAVKIDPEFAFAYDNMGICYRRLNEFDKAIDAYEKSLSIDPNGKMPLQNIAVAYQYKKQYQKAINAYSKLAEIDSNDPEIFYGIGQIYALNLKQEEKGLDYLCKAYNLYVAQKSPYRTDAEKLIQMVYAEMKEQGKEAKFNEILKNNNISPQ